MKKAQNKLTEPEMRAEYDFARGVQGKYARGYEFVSVRGFLLHGYG